MSTVKKLKSWRPSLNCSVDITWNITKELGPAHRESFCPKCCLMIILQWSWESERKNECYSCLLSFANAPLFIFFSSLYHHHHHFCVGIFTKHLILLDYFEADQTTVASTTTTTVVTTTPSTVLTTTSHEEITEQSTTATTEASTINSNALSTDTKEYTSSEGTSLQSSEEATNASGGTSTDHTSSEAISSNTSKNIILETTAEEFPTTGETSQSTKKSSSEIYADSDTSQTITDYQPSSNATSESTTRLTDTTATVFASNDSWASTEITISTADVVTSKATTLVTTTESAMTTTLSVSSQQSTSSSPNTTAQMTTTVTTPRGTTSSPQATMTITTSTSLPTLLPTVAPACKTKSFRSPIGGNSRINMVLCLPFPSAVTYPVSSDYYFPDLNSNMTKTNIGNVQVVGGPFGFGSAVQVASSETTCLHRTNFFADRDKDCFQNPGNCTSGISVSIWENINMDLNDKNQRYILSTGKKKSLGNPVNLSSCNA